VFEDDPQGGQLSQVWIENADGSNVRKVVSDAFTDFAASPSPDGRTILFYRVAPPPSQVPGVMMIVNVDGSGLHEVKVGDQARGCDDGPEGDSWSPDGKRIVYVRFCFDRAGQFVESAIWTIGPDGTDAHRVTRHLPADQVEDHRVGWSPDGKSLTFERIDISVTPERAAIFTIGTDGKNLHQVTPWSLDGNDPDWSPDGSLIAFNASAEPSPTQNIYTIHPDGTGLAKLTTYEEPKQATYHPTWSPDGAHILFSHAPSTGGWADFYVMDADGGNQVVLAHTELHENHGTWGPSVRP
jgi:Tol biopolymer transport system component